MYKLDFIKWDLPCYVGQQHKGKPNMASQSNKRRRGDDEEEYAGEQAEEERSNPLANEPALSMLKFRNYVPRDRDLRYFRVPYKIDPDTDQRKYYAPKVRICTSPRPRSWGSGG